MQVNGAQCRSFLMVQNPASKCSTRPQSSNKCLLAKRSVIFRKKKKTKRNTVLNNKCLPGSSSAKRVHKKITCDVGGKKCSLVYKREFTSRIHKLIILNNKLKQNTNIQQSPFVLDCTPPPL